MKAHIFTATTESTLNTILDTHMVKEEGDLGVPYLCQFKSNQGVISGYNYNERTPSFISTSEDGSVSSKTITLDTAEIVLYCHTNRQTLVLSTDADWVTISQSSFGSGDTYVTLSVAENDGSSSRTAIINALWGNTVCCTFTLKQNPWLGHKVRYRIPEDNTTVTLRSGTTTNATDIQILDGSLNPVATLTGNTGTDYTFSSAGTYVVKFGKSAGQWATNDFYLTNYIDQITMVGMTTSLSYNGRGVNTSLTTVDFSQVGAFNGTLPSASSITDIWFRYRGTSTLRPSQNAFNAVKNSSTLTVHYPKAHKDQYTQVRAYFPNATFDEFDE